MTGELATHRTAGVATGAPARVEATSRVAAQRATREGVVTGTPAAPGARPLGPDVPVRSGPGTGWGEWGGWGWLPGLSAVIAVGLLLVAVADSGARFGAPWAGPLFWLGLALAFGATATRLAAEAPGRSERLLLVLLLGMGLYLVKVLHSPLGFTFHDEFLHWRTADDIATSGRLYGENPLLPVSALFPGLEIVTGALSSLGALSLFEAGTFLIGAGRLLMLVTLFLLFESVSRSARVAGLASLLYMANPNFVFFGAQYSYESLALPLATLALLAARRWALAAGGPAEGVAWALAFCGALWATVMTHHLTAYALAGFLVLWLLACLWRARGPASGRRETLVAATAAALGVGASLAWLLSAGSATFGYLAPVLSGGVADLAGWIAGQTQLRRLFSDFAGQRSPLWEQLLGFVAVGLILLGLPFGLLQIWRRHRAEAMAVALGVVVLAYPVTLALRLTERGAETSNRSSEFLFVGIAFVLALAAVERWLPPQRLPVALPAGAVEVLGGALATLLFAGGVIVGWGPLARLPGPYLMGTDTRSIEAQGVAGAHTLLRLLGPGNRLAADRTNRLLLGSFGRQRPVSAFADWVGVAPLYFSSEVGPAEREILRRGRIRYVVVDRRLGSGLPPVGVFVELGEANTNRHTAPITPGALAKFDTVQGVGRVYDSGDIVVYDVEALQR